MENFAHAAETPPTPDHSGQLTEAHRCLAERVAGLTGEAMEHRHESLMAWACDELGMERSFAQDVFTLAEEETLQPVYAFQILACGLGVRELEEPQPDMDPGETHQAVPPEWVQEDVVELSDVALERRLRATFRRFRHYLTETGDPAAAVAAFISEPDVDLVRLR